MGVKLLNERCINCNVCRNLVNCPMGNVKSAIETGKCTGCGACTIACPQEALVRVDGETPKVNVFVNGKEVCASKTVKSALEAAGINITKFPSTHKNHLFVPCDCGGCWTCTVKVNGKIRPACVTPLKEGMEMELIENDMPVLRVVSGFGAHSVGGVGTPYWLKNLKGPVEVVGFTHGCNLRCPQCQNFQTALTAGGHLIEPHEASQILLGLKEAYQVDRITISGGESTLNRKWLLEVIAAIRDDDNRVNIHVDTNGTILTHDYIDELVERGMTDIGIDLKSLYILTYMNITGLDDEKLAQKYLYTSWSAVSYIVNNYSDLFLGIGIPYNAALISRGEIQKMGEKINKMKSDVQVCVLDYRPEFRRKELIKPSAEEMIRIKKLLNQTGLETVIIQTDKGHLGP